MTQAVRVWGLVPAAGSGVRFGGAKQFRRLGDETLLERVVAVLASAVEHVVVALPDGAPASLAPDRGAPLPEHVTAVSGGATRLASVRAALAAIPPEVDVVVVHGPSHPLATADLVDHVVAAVLAGADAAAPGLPVLDALKVVDADGVVRRTLPKTGVQLAQTPQAFRATTLRRAHLGDPDTAEDSELVELIGGRVVMVAGDPANLHIASPADLVLAHRLLGLDPPA